MGQSDDVEDSTYSRHQDLCQKLNMDATAASEAWKSYETIRQNYTLEVFFELLIILIISHSIHCFRLINVVSSSLNYKSKICFFCCLSAIYKSFNSPAQCLTLLNSRFVLLNRLKRTNLKQ